MFKKQSKKGRLFLFTVLDARRVTVGELGGADHMAPTARWHREMSTQAEPTLLFTQSIIPTPGGAPVGYKVF